MKNRSLSFWIIEACKTSAMTIGISFVYMLFMGYVQADSVQSVQNLISAGFPFYALMQFVFLARFSLMVGQEYIPLCLSFGETRKNVMTNTIISLVLQLVAATVVLGVLLFVAASGEGQDSIVYEITRNRAWAMCGLFAVELLPIAVSFLASNISLVTEGRSMNWLPFVTIFGSMVIAMVAFFMFMIFGDSWYGNWLVVVIPMIVDVICLASGLVWLKQILKKYQVSL